MSILYSGAGGNATLAQIRAPKKPAKSSPGALYSGVGGKATAAQVKAPIKKVAPKPAPKPKAAAPKPKATGGSKAVSSGSIGSTATKTVEPPKPKQLSEKEWRAQDSAFKAEQSSIDAELKSMLANIANQRTQYDANLADTFGNLGLKLGAGTGGDQFTNATWDRDNLLGAYGQAMNNQVNDFAARGLLDSGLYLQDQDTLTRGFDKQRSSLNTGRQQTMDDLDMQKASAQTSSESALNRAKAEAAMRRAAAYGLTGV